MQNKRRRNKASKFIPNLHKILSDKESGAEWRDDDRSFVLNDISKLTSNSLLKYFRHSNISSFIRQLNLYGFKKLVGQDIEQNTYYHDKFKKNYITQLKPIRSFYNQQKYGKLRKTPNTDFKEANLSSSESNAQQDLANKTGCSSDCHSECQLKQKIATLLTENQRLRAVEQEHIRLLSLLSSVQKPFGIYDQKFEQKVNFQDSIQFYEGNPGFFCQQIGNYGSNLGNEQKGQNLMHQYTPTHYYMAFQGIL